MSETWRPTLTGVLLVAVAYFVTGRLGLMLPALGTNITLIWLPTGIAVAALFRWGFQVWPGIALGAATVNLAVGTPWGAACAIAVGNTLGPLLAAWVLRRTGLHPTFDRKRDIVFLTIAAALGMLVSASLGVSALTLAGMLPARHLAAGLIWWAGDTMGVITAAPLILAYSRKEARAILGRRVEFTLWLAVTVAVTCGVFIFDRSFGGHTWSLAFLPLPLVAWAAMRHGPIGTSVALILISTGAACGTATDHGPFSQPYPVESVVVLWVFMCTAAVLGWLITALQAARVLASGLQRLLEQSLDDVSLGVLLAGLDRRITYTNQGFTRLTGYAEAQILGKSCAVLQGAETDPATIATLKAAVLNGAAFEGEILNYRKDGTTFWNALAISPVRDEHGTMTGFIGLQRDITKRKKVEDALRESEVRYRQLFEANPHPMWVYDLETLRFLAVNAAAVAHYGYSQEEFRAMTIKDIRPPQDVPALLAHLAQVGAGLDDAGVWRHRRRDGTIIDVEITSHVLDFDGCRAEVVLAHDVTERNRAEEERLRLVQSLQESQIRLETLVGNLPGMAYRCRNDPEWTMTYVSESCEAITGYRRDELENNRVTTYASLIHPDDRDWLWAKCQAYLATRTPCQNEYRILDQQGRERWVSERATGVYGEADTLLFIDGFIQDITARRAAELEREQLDRKVQETQKLESLGVLAGGIAHDFNNILTAVLGNASLAELELPAGSRVREYVEEINLAGQRAADLCRQMLAYSGRGRFVVQKLDLSQVVEETTRMLQVSISKKAVLHFHLEKGLPTIEADATQIRQIVMNLVINASEAIGERSGRIRLCTGLALVADRPGRGTLHDPELPEGEYVYLEVTDTGGGMSAETQARIFDPFFTTKFTGRGLGLAAVLGIVRGHRGTIKVESEPGRGTTFKLLFPVAADGSELPNGAPGHEPAWRGSGTVLIVDDEDTIRGTAARMLGLLGFTPVLAADGLEALACFREDPRRFALVLLDLTMPHLDGEETFAELRRLRPDARVVLMSGFNPQEVLIRFRSQGLASFLPKPFTFESMRSVIRSVFD